MNGFVVPFLCALCGAWANNGMRAKRSEASNFSLVIYEKNGCYSLKKCACRCLISFLYGRKSGCFDKLFRAFAAFSINDSGNGVADVCHAIHIVLQTVCTHRHMSTDSKINNYKQASAHSHPSNHSRHADGMDFARKIQLLAAPNDEAGTYGGRRVH